MEKIKKMFSSKSSRNGTYSVGLAVIVIAIAIVIMAGIREKIEYNDISESFQGTPIVLLTAALMSIAFFGFSGII